MSAYDSLLAAMNEGFVGNGPHGKKPWPECATDVALDWFPDRGEIAEVLGAHRWKDMGVDWCSCECGAILRETDDTYGAAFPGDSLFRLHLADAILGRIRTDAGQ